MKHKKNQKKYLLFFLIPFVLILIIIFIYLSFKKEIVIKSIKQKESNNSSTLVDTEKEEITKIYTLKISLKNKNKIDFATFRSDFVSNFGDDFKLYIYNKDDSTDIVDQQEYFLLVENNIKLEKLYKNNNYEVIVTPNNSIDIRYLESYNFCQTDNDCSVGNYFCSYGAFNRYKQILLPYGCESGIYDYQSKYTFGLSDEKMNCNSQVKYQNTKCIKNKCTGQDRTIKCIGKLEY